MWLFCLKTFLIAMNKNKHRMLTTLCITLFTHLILKTILWSMCWGTASRWYSLFPDSKSILLPLGWLPTVSPGYSSNSLGPSQSDISLLFLCHLLMNILYRISLLGLWGGTCSGLYLWPADDHLHIHRVFSLYMHVVSKFLPPFLKNKNIELEPILMTSF